MPQEVIRKVDASEIWQGSRKVIVDPNSSWSFLIELQVVIDGFLKYQLYAYCQNVQNIIRHIITVQCRVVH